MSDCTHQTKCTSSSSPWTDCSLAGWSYCPQSLEVKGKHHWPDRQHCSHKSHKYTYCLASTLTLATLVCVNKSWCCESGSPLPVTWRLPKIYWGQCKDCRSRKPTSPSMQRNGGESPQSSIVKGTQLTVYLLLLLIIILFTILCREKWIHKVNIITGYIHILSLSITACQATPIFQLPICAYFRIPFTDCWHSNHAHFPSWRHSAPKPHPQPLPDCWHHFPCSLWRY